MGLLFLSLEILNFKTLVRQVSMEVYGALVGVIFLVFGLWLGVTMVQKRQSTPLNVKPPETNLSEREYDVLQLMADGKSNKEIAEQLFVSLNTIKTHTSNIFSKLDVQRRTQAVQKARKLEIL